MEIYNKKSITDSLYKYDYLVNKDSSDFIEVTEWHNGEGINVTINEKHFSLTYGELDAVIYLSKTLEYAERG